MVSLEVVTRVTMQETKSLIGKVWLITAECLA